MWVFSLYTMVDGIFVSKGASELALAAVNISMPFINFIFAISILFSTGDSTIFAILNLDKLAIFLGATSSTSTMVRDYLAIIILFNIFS